MTRVYPPHYSNYLDFMAKGGLTAWILAHGASILEEHRYAGGNLAVLAIGEPAKEIASARRL